MELTLDQQDAGRNSIVCLKGFILQLKKAGKITENEKDLCYVWISKAGRVYDAELQSD